MIVNVQHISLARSRHSNLRTSIMRSLRGESTGKEPINNTHSSFEIQKCTRMIYMYTLKRPEKQGRIRSNILINANFIGASVVHVVLVTPPSWAHTTTNVAERPHKICPLATSMHVVMRQPAGNGVRNAEHGSSQKLHVQCLELSEHNASCKPACP